LASAEDYALAMNTQVPLPATVQFAPDYPIVTERLALRPFSRGDVDAVYSYRSREDVSEYLFDQPMTHEECAEAVRARAGQIAFSNEGDKIVLAVERRDDARLIGEVSLIWRSVSDLQGEIGYIFHPDAHGHGYASEASRALLAFGFEVMGLHRVYARCDALNSGSERVMQRLGMRKEAHFREHAQFKGRWDEELIYAILEGEWFAPAASR
jgi:RimJ/RimL family protein N-acetyltransferase